MRKNILSTLGFAALATLTFTARPLASSAQEVKTFTEYVMQQDSQSEQDNPDDIRPYMVPYLTSRTHYKVISSFYSDALYNVSEGAFCLIDKNLLTVWTIDGEYLFGPEWKALGTRGDNNMLFDNGALIAKSAKKATLQTTYLDLSKPVMPLSLDALPKLSLSVFWLGANNCFALPQPA